MATTLNEVAELLFEADYTFKIEKELNEVWLRKEGLETYKQQNGDDILLIVIRPSKEGEYIEIFSPLCYELPKEPDREALFYKACTILNSKNGMAIFGSDPTNDEKIRATIRFPIMDSKITQNQLVRCIDDLIRFLNESYPVLNLIYTDGVFDINSYDKRKWIAEMFGSIDKDVEKKLIEKMRKKKEE